MKPATTIRLLTSTTNQKGDLFTRLMKDLSYALSYEDIRLDVHKTGREIDIQGHHRYEARLLKAECKAHVSKMGGAELNKFFGALTRERKKAEEPVSLGAGWSGKKEYTNPNRNNTPTTASQILLFM